MVMVVRGPHCCLRPYGDEGRIFTVSALKHHESRCSLCKSARFGMLAEREGGPGAFVSRLKRIPPLDELEGEKLDEEIHA